MSGLTLGFWDGDKRWILYLDYDDDWILAEILNCICEQYPKSEETKK